MVEAASQSISASFSKKTFQVLSIWRVLIVWVNFQGQKDRAVQFSGGTA